MASTALSAAPMRQICSLRPPSRPLPAAPLLRRPRRRAVCLASGAASVPAPDGSSSNGAGAAAGGNGAGPAGEVQQAGQQQQQGGGGFFGWLKAQQAQKQKLASLGLAAVLAYGLFDGVSYTIAFALAFLGYEARTGLNPTQNVADIVKICILMWAGNNVTRPFRLAGAAALAPFMDRLMERLQARLKLRSKAAAFAIMAASVAVVCFSILGALFFSRWVRG